MARDDLARRIHEVALLEGEFLLRSGAISKIYFDKYRFEAEPQLLREIAEAMAPLIPPEAELLAGLEMGGIPLVTMLSQITGKPSLFVRKEAKKYGTCNLVEGGAFQGRKLVVVEDVVTSGGQVVISAAQMRELGADIIKVVCVIDRESSGAQNLAKEGLIFEPLFRIVRVAESSRGGTLSRPMLRIARPLPMPQQHRRALGFERDLTHDLTFEGPEQVGQADRPRGELRLV